MIGTLINVAAILIGGAVGLLFGSKIPEKVRRTIVHGLGLFTLCYAVISFFKSENYLVPLASMIIGTVLGEWWQIEERLASLGDILRKRFIKTDQSEVQTSGTAQEQPLTGVSANARERFITGFVTASLLFCIGPMAILGSIQDGLTGNFQMLVIKSTLDGITSIAFAAAMGIGVLFSALVTFVFQGGISLIAKLAGRGFDTAAVNEMTAVGGIILAGIAISSLLEIKKIRTGSFLPAIFLVVAIVYGLKALGINY